MARRFASDDPKKGLLHHSSRWSKVGIDYESSCRIDPIGDDAQGTDEAEPNFDPDLADDDSACWYRMADVARDDSGDGGSVSFCYDGQFEPVRTVAEYAGWECGGGGGRGFDWKRLYFCCESRSARRIGGILRFLAERAFLGAAADVLRTYGIVPDPTVQKTSITLIVYVIDSDHPHFELSHRHKDDLEEDGLSASAAGVVGALPGFAASAAAGFARTLVGGLVRTARSSPPPKQQLLLVTAFLPHHLTPPSAAAPPPGSTNSNTSNINNNPLSLQQLLTSMVDLVSPEHAEVQRFYASVKALVGMLEAAAASSGGDAAAAAAAAGAAVQHGGYGVAKAAREQAAIAAATALASAAAAGSADGYGFGFGYDAASSSQSSTSSSSSSGANGLGGLGGGFWIGAKGGRRSCMLRRRTCAACGTGWCAVRPLGEVAAAVAWA
ncbi:hypothetical protein DFJ73DRAFT_777436 [Zopfochytrium polystomum]|nr:hypothetical protein DFJ73DRAFT_777436 [Zopfochytrium polystomum]